MHLFWHLFTARNKILSKLFLLKKILMDLIWIMNTHFEVILMALLLLDASHKQYFSTIVLLVNNLFMILKLVAFLINVECCKTLMTLQ